MGDIHLYDRELKSTKGYVKSNDVLLDNLIAFIKDNEEITAIILSGDVQHKTPQNIQLMAKWRSKFKEMGDILGSRGFWENVTEIQGKNEGAPPIFSLRGNHDFEIEQKQANDYTFFDDLLQEKLIHNPRLIKLNNIALDFRDYGNEEDIYTKEDPDEYLISMFHNFVLFGDDNNESAYSVATHAPESDIIILGHIHTAEDPKQGTHANGKRFHYLVPGSLARTQTDKRNFRDTGNIVVLDLNTKGYETVELDLLPFTELFDFAKITRNRNRTSPENLILDLDNIDICTEEFNVSELIEAMDIKEELKELAINLYEQVDIR